MFRIDWEKYLTPERGRQSNSFVSKDGNDKRNVFDSDLGRVIFSSALRRMHDKTQVIPLTSGDYVHTRLTHSLEVMSIAYSLGIDLCRHSEFLECYTVEEVSKYEREIPVILKVAALVHDIGNPPFGHFGESVIQKYFENYFENHGVVVTESQMLDFTQFDGNAQGFRILTKLQYLGDLYGLNLTYPTLAAYMKYPNIGKKDKRYIGTKKHGVFTSEEDIFNMVVDGCHLKDNNNNNKIKRHPLSFLVEAADTICYDFMDIEDGLEKGWYKFADVVNFLIHHINEKIKDSGFDIKEMPKLESQEPKTDGKSDRRLMVELRIKLMQYLVNTTIDTFIKHLEEIDKGEYNKELLEEDPLELSNAFQKFAQQYIYPQEEIEKVELTGSTVIKGLLDFLIDYAFNTDPQYRKRAKSVLSKTCMKVARHEEEDNPCCPQPIRFYTKEEMWEFDLESLSVYSKFRIIVDFVSGMTDKYALTVYQQLSGQKL